MRSGVTNRVPLTSDGRSYAQRHLLRDTRRPSERRPGKGYWYARPQALVIDEERSFYVMETFGLSGLPPPACSEV